EHEKRFIDQVDGVGLYRTEIPFMVQSGFPSEDEQMAQYESMLRLYPENPVMLRTLDIGADKPLPYMPISEENPSLGWRGIRVTLDQPEIFLIQVRAMLRANAALGNLHILLPMINSLDEIDEARRLIDRAAGEVTEMLNCPQPRPRIGIMIEVPSMLFLLPHLSSRIDFVSVGTNDLTQYLLAVDRNNPHVGALYDSLHPSMLQALHLIVTQCRQARLPVSVCGEMAGEPIGALLLIGMGYRSLSMNGRNVARIKYLLRHIEQEEAGWLADKVLTAQTATEARQWASLFIEERGLGGLIRGGR
ncbi:putative PEP-binding protein, partial [Lonsdalea populi]